MKKTVWWLLGLLMMIGIVFAVSGVEASAAEETVDYRFQVKERYDLAYEVFDIVNEERAKEGRDPLTMDEELLKAAMQRAAELVIYYSHTRPDGTSCGTVCDKLDGENIAMGQTNSVWVMSGWMNSSGHRANILREWFRSIGVGVVEAGGALFWVQVFSFDAAPQYTTTGTVNAYHTVRTLTEHVAPYFMKTSYQLNTGKTQTLRMQLLTPEDLEYDEILFPVYVLNSGFTWKSSNTAVATVSSGGVVTGVSPGTVTITAVSKTNSAVKATTKVTVKRPVTAVTLSRTALTLNVGSAYTLTATVTPSNATDKKITWKSGNVSVATVSASGKVTAKKAGTATISATSADGKVRATCKVTVKIPPVASVTVEPASLIMRVGTWEELTPKVLPAAANQDVTYKSSNPSVVSVNEYGDLYGEKTGTATITITASGGKKATCKVTVNQFGKKIGEALVCAETWALSDSIIYLTPSERIPEGTKVSVYNKNDLYSLVAYNGKPAQVPNVYLYDLATKTPAASDRIGQGVCTQTADFYTLPTTSSQKLGTLKPGTLRNLSAQAGNWDQIYTGGRYAWVRVDGFDYTKSVARGKLGTAVMNNSAITYYGPGYDFEPSVLLYSGQAVNFYKKQGNWFLVYRSGHFLWLNESNLTQIKYV